MTAKPSPTGSVWHPRRDVLRGAYIELAQLTGTRFAAAEIALPSLLQARGSIAGAHRSRARGRGLEFEEVRAYQAGDDIRNIDWRVTARSGQPFTKLFREERERPLVLLVDQRQPMFFGSRTCFKSALAAYLGALIAWAGLNNGDRIGGLVLADTETSELRPRHTRASMTAWLRTLHQFNQRLRADTPWRDDAEITLTKALGDLRRTTRPGSAIVLISDFRGTYGELAREQLHRLAQHNTITALRVFDPLEAELPPPAHYTITDGRQRLSLDSGDRALREKHRQHFSEHTLALQKLFGSLGASYLQISTAEPPLLAIENQIRGSRRTS